MKHFIEFFNSDNEVVKVYKTSYSSLRKAMVRLYDLSLQHKGLFRRYIRVRREDGLIYHIKLFDNGVYAVSNETGKVYQY